MKRKKAKSRSRARKNTAPVHFEHGESSLTSYAGLIPVIKFLENTLGLSLLFRNTVEHRRADNAQYELVDGVFLVLIALIGGARSLSQCTALWSDGVLRRMAGWVRVPDATTLGRLFREVKERHINGLETLIHRCRQRVWKQALRRGVSRIATQCIQWIDVDSTVKTVFGQQEGAEKGYNTHKRGARSYHPLLAFSADTKEILQAWYRSGSAYTSNGIVEFMRQLLAAFPSHVRIVFRGDSGFYVSALFDLLDSLGHGYLVKVKMRNLVGLLSAQYWSPIRGKPGWEQAEFTYKGRIYVAVRQRKALDSCARKGNSSAG